ncbi:hypothetical protein ABW21_db0209118 [Orbilia brochopaga]|nr:hypothetical protein ABW21_db0209118 [Drechslerella brochopaga]
MPNFLAAVYSSITAVLGLFCIFFTSFLTPDDDDTDNDNDSDSDTDDDDTDDYEETSDDESAWTLDSWWIEPSADSPPASTPSPPATTSFTSELSSGIASAWQPFAFVLLYQLAEEGWWTSLNTLQPEWRRHATYLSYPAFTALIAWQWAFSGNWRRVGEDDVIAHDMMRTSHHSVAELVILSSAVASFRALTNTANSVEFGSIWPHIHGVSWETYGWVLFTGLCYGIAQLSAVQVWRSWDPIRGSWFVLLPSVYLVILSVT